MAKFQAARFAPAAAAFVASGAVATAKDTAATQAACKALAATLGDTNPAAVAGLLAVAKLRPSIARRFVSIAIAAVPAPRKPRAARKPRVAKVAPVAAVVAKVA